MEGEHHCDVDEGQAQSRHPRITTSTRILRYCLLCGSVAVLAGHVAIVGIMAEGFSERIILSVSMAVAFVAVLALPVGVIAIALCGLVESKCSNSVIQTIARILSDLVVGPLLVVLFFLVLGSGNLLFQLSLGQFLVGDEEIQYRHLMILSAYGGIFFGIYAGWQGKFSHGLSWLKSIFHGVRVFVEAGFLAYAGLWLLKAAFEYALAEGKAENWEVTVIAFLGAALIFAGSLSLMERQARMRPQMAENAEQIPFRVRVRQQFQDLKRAISASKRGLDWWQSKFRK